MGVTLFQKVGVPIFVKFGSLWAVESRGGVRPMGVGSVPPPKKKILLLTLEKAHFGGYLTHSDVLILKLWFAVHRMLHGCATDSVNFSPTGCSSWGLAPLSPERFRPCLSPFSSHASPSAPFLFPFISFLAKLTLRMFSVHCNVHYGPTPHLHHIRACDTFENRSFERLLKPVIVYRQ